MNNDHKTTNRDRVKPPSTTYSSLLEGSLHAQMNLKYHFDLIRNNLSDIQADLDSFHDYGARYNEIVFEDIFAYLHSPNHIFSAVSQDTIVVASADTLTAKPPSPADLGNAYLSQFQSPEDMGQQSLLRTAAPHLLKMVTGWIETNQTIRAEQIAALSAFFGRYAEMKVPNSEMTSDALLAFLEYTFNTKGEAKAADKTKPANPKTKLVGPDDKIQTQKYS